MLYIWSPHFSMLCYISIKVDTKGTVSIYGRDGEFSHYLGCVMFPFPGNCEISCKPFSFCKECKQTSGHQSLMWLPDRSFTSNGHQFCLPGWRCKLSSGRRVSVGLRFWQRHHCPAGAQAASARPQGRHSSSSGVAAEWRHLHLSLCRGSRA